MQKSINMKETHKVLSQMLYERTIDFVQEQCFEMLKEIDLINDLDDKGIHLMNKVMGKYFNKKNIEQWAKQ